MSATGKKQRTKGNAKPSSSARAAELLSASGYGIPNTIGFMGFDAIPINADLEGSSFSTGNVEEPEDLDEDFRVAFRKAVKKDSITKTKALREINSLISDKETKTVLAAWQCWPRLYSKLALDGNFKVRELAHSVLGAFAQKLSRQVANQLKSVVPYWLMGEHDTYQVAAQAAKQTFQDAFPSGKRPQVLAFCKEAIISQLTFSVDEATAAASSSDTTEESAESRAIRISSCSLWALHTFLATISDEELANCQDTLQQSLFALPKFWKLADKAKPTPVRIAWFNFVLCLIRRKHTLLSEKASKLVPVIVNALEETDGTVVGPVWECFSSYLKVNAEEFWQNCNLRKAFLPKLISITRKAFSGCSGSIGHSVITAIAYLPNSEDIVDIYNKLLTAFHAGCTHLLTSKVSSSEAVAFTRVYCDFVKIMCSNSLAVEFAKDFLRDSEKSLFVTSSYLKSSSPLLVRGVFEYIADMVSTITDEFPAKESGLTDAVSAYQSNLYQVVMLELQTKTSTASLSNLLIALESRTPKFKSSCASIYLSCWKLYEQTSDGDYLRIFRDVLCAAVDVTGFITMIESENDAAAAAEKFGTRLLFRLSHLDEKQTAEVAQIGYLLDCCFALVPVLDASRKVEMLKKLCQLQSFDGQYQFLFKLRQAKNEPLLEIIPKGEFASLFMECFKTVCSAVSVGSTIDEQKKQWRLFTEYLAGTSAQGSSTVPTHVAAAALDHLTSLIGPESTGRHLSLIVGLVGQLASEALVSHKELLTDKAGVELVNQLFDLYCAHSDELNEDALGWTKKAWSTALSTHINNKHLVTEGPESFVSRLAHRLLDHVTKAGLHRERLEWLCSIAVDIVSTCKGALSKSEKSDLDESLSAVVTCLLPMVDAELLTNARGNVDRAWIINAVVSGRYPVLDLGFCENNFVASSPDRFAGTEFLNLAAYALRFGHYLNVADPPFFEQLASLTDQHAVMAIRGFVAIAYIYHTTSLLPIRRDYEHVSPLKAFGSWTSLIAVDFWESLPSEERRNVAVTAVKRILASNDSLAAQAMEFLQYEAGKLELLFDGLRYDNLQVNSMLSASPSLLESHGNYHEPNTLSPRTVSGYLNVAGHNMVKRLSAFDWLMTVKKEFLDDRMLFSCDISEADDDVIVLNISLMQYFEQVIYCLVEMSSEQRDFLLCATLTWLQSCAESDLSNGRARLFAIYATRLFCAIAKFMESGKDDPKTQALAEEWTEFFLKGCVQILVPMFLRVSKYPSSSSHLQPYLVREIAASIAFARHDDLMDVDLPLLLEPELDSLGYPEKLQSVLLNALPLLESSTVPVQVAAFSILQMFVGQFYEYESKAVKETDGSETRDIPSYFLVSINRLYESIEHEFDEVHHLENSPAFSSYFLTWKLLLKFFASVKTEDRPAYSSALSSSKILDKLMLTLLAVLPENISSSAKNQSPDGTGLNRKLQQYTKRFDDIELKSVIEASDVSRLFLEPPEYSKETPTTRYVQQYACHVFFEALRSFPAAVRHWFNCQEKKVANVVEKFVMKYVSPLLCSFELQAITKGEKKYENMTLLARPSAREVVACYKLEELTMELVVTLPQNYPLSAAAVDIDRRVGVSVEQWRKWMLQLTVFLSHQNGGLLDGMMLWKRCIDKHLQGVEDCMICMMAVHGSNYQLPKITCRQCKKKFHAACLYKWFNTSSNTSCPLCRTGF